MHWQGRGVVRRDGPHPAVEIYVDRRRPLRHTLFFAGFTTLAILFTSGVPLAATLPHLAGSTVLATMTILGLSILVRRGPALAVTPHGLSISTPGSITGLVPWSDVVAVQPTSSFLHVEVTDPERLLPRYPALVRPLVRREMRATGVAAFTVRVATGYLPIAGDELAAEIREFAPEHVAVLRRYQP